jgi:hypothetical protein
VLVVAPRRMTPKAGPSARKVARCDQGVLLARGELAGHRFSSVGREAVLVPAALVTDADSYARLMNGGHSAATSFTGSHSSGLISSWLIEGRYCSDFWWTHSPMPEAA